MSAPVSGSSAGSKDPRASQAPLTPGTVALLALAAIAACAVAGRVFGPAIGVLVLAGASLVAAIAAMWASLRSLTGDTALTIDDALALGAPTAEEEQKRAVLRAIKDIEFEHAVGKLSDQDYAQLVARYRAEAKRLLRVLDERAAPERARAEKVAVRHLAAAGLIDAPQDVPVKSGKKKKKKKKRDCGACGVKNDVDAAFCKGCGKGLA